MRLQFFSIMFVVDKKRKINAYKRCHIPSGQDLFSRFGQRLPQSFEGEDSGEVIPMNMSKLDSIEYLQRYDAYMNRRDQYEAAQSEAETQGNNQSQSSAEDN